MAILDKKDRMISFRLSTAEYKLAERVCKTNGMRSVSMLAYFAPSGMIEGEEREDGVSQRRLARFEQQLKGLALQIGQLEQKSSRKRS